MKEIIIIAAVSKNNVIGKDNKMPWYIKEDFMHFKELTTGYPIVMGKTHTFLYLKNHYLTEKTLFWPLKMLIIREQLLKNP